MQIPRAAVMILCLAAGFRVSLALRTDWIGERTEAQATTAETTTSPAPSRSRKLHLEHLWSQRRPTLNTTEAEPRVLAAITADKWDDASQKELVSLLIASPSFINTIWNQADPETRNKMMAKVFKTVIEANPSTALALLDEGKFDFSKIPGIGDTLNRTVYYGRAPIDAFDAAKRNRDKLGEKELQDMMWGMGRYKEIARPLLNDAALGTAYPKRKQYVMENAASRVWSKSPAERKEVLAKVSELPGPQRNRVLSSLVSVTKPDDPAGIASVLSQFTSFNYQRDHTEQWLKKQGEEGKQKLIAELDALPDTASVRKLRASLGEKAEKGQSGGADADPPD